MRCRMVGRWSVPKTAAAVANSGAAAQVVAVAVKWRTWAMRAARILRTAPMRPGMGRGLVGVGVVGAAWVMGMVVAGLGERSKNFVIGFLMRGYVGCPVGSTGNAALIVTSNAPQSVQDAPERPGAIIRAAVAGILEGLLGGGPSYRDHEQQRAPEPPPPKLDPNQFSEAERAQRRAALAQKFGGDLQTEDEQVAEIQARHRRESSQQQR